MSLVIEAVETVSTTGAHDERGRCATLARTVERMAEDGACRLEISTAAGEPLIEIVLVAPMPVNLVRRVLDAVETIASAAADQLFVNARPVLRRSYRGANNWVARARLRTRPSRFGP